MGRYSTSTEDLGIVGHPTTFYLTSQFSAIFAFFDFCFHKFRTSQHGHVLSVDPLKRNMARRWRRDPKSAPLAHNLYAPAALPRDPQLVSLPISTGLTALAEGNPTATPQHSPTTTIATVGVASSTSTTVNYPGQTLSASGSTPATQPNTAENAVKSVMASGATPPSESDSTPTSAPSGINDLNPLNVTQSIVSEGTTLKAVPTTPASPFHTNPHDSQSPGSPEATTDSGTDWGGPKLSGSQPGTKAKYAAIAAVVVVLVLVLLCTTLFYFRRRHRKQLLPGASHWWLSIKPTKPTSESCNNAKSSTQSRSSWSSFGSPLDRVAVEDPKPEISPLPRSSDANSLVRQSDGASGNASTSSLLSVSPCLSIFTTPSYEDAGPVPSMESYLLSGQDDDPQCVEGQHSSRGLSLSGVTTLSSNSPVPTPSVPPSDYNLFVGRNPFDDP